MTLKTGTEKANIVLRLLNRTPWLRLSVQGKIIATAIVLGGLLIGAALLTFVQVIQLQQQQSQVFDSIVQMRAEAQNVEFNIESLDRIQTGLTQDVTVLQQNQYDLLVRVLPADFETTLADIETSASVIDEQLNTIPFTSTDLETLESELAIVNDTIAISQARFNTLIALVEELAEPQNGAINQLTTLGDVLENRTRDFGDESPRLLSQVLLLRSLEQRVIDTGASADLAAFNVAVDDYLELYRTELAIAERDTIIPNLLAQYQQQAGIVQQLLQELDVQSTSADFTINVMRDSASRMGRLVDAEFGSSIQRLNQNRARTFGINAIVLLVVIGVSFFVLLAFGRDLTERIAAVLAAASRMEQGNLDSRVDYHGEDEVSQLGRSFNAVGLQLSALVSGLEQRVAERTRDLSITRDIGQLVVELRNPRELMSEIVELIRNRFGFYHAQVFLIDDRNERANLVASTGAAGRQLLARQHFLNVGSQSVIGQVTSRGEPVVALDTDTDIVHRRNELLPDTRSEMALPMRIGNQVIGALDVQSVAPNAFDDDDIAVFQIIADQLATALDNARLYTELNETREAMELMQKAQTGKAWAEFAHDRDPGVPLAYRLESQELTPGIEDLPEAVQNAVRSGIMIAKPSTDSDYQLAVPIRVRGEVIGAFGFAGDPLDDITEDDIALVEAVVDRVGLALENLRLVEDAARRAEQEHVVNEISAKIVGSTDINYILQTAVRELGRVLRAPQTSVQLRSQAGEE